MRKKLWLLPVLVMLASLALVACGGSDDDKAGSEDESAITGQVELAATSGDPAACESAQTEAFNEQTTGETGAAATEACRQDAANTAAESVSVDDIEVDGDSATAKVAATGGQLDGQTLNMKLVKDGDTWKLDAVDGFAEFDRDKLIATFESRLGSEQIPPDVVDCIKSKLPDASDEDLQALVIGTGDAAAEKLFGDCG